MPEVTAETIENTATKLGERIQGKRHVMGHAWFDLRALDNEDKMYTSSAPAGCDADVRLAAVVEMTCRLGIVDWSLRKISGEPVPIERAQIRRDGPLAITKECIRRLPYDAQYELFGEISELELSDAEEQRLDFTTAWQGAKTQS